MCIHRLTVSCKWRLLWTSNFVVKFVTNALKTRKAWPAKTPEFRKAKGIPSNATPILLLKRIIPAWVCACMCLNIHMYACVCVCMCMLKTYICSYINTCMHVCMHTVPYACMSSLAWNRVNNNEKNQKHAKKSCQKSCNVKSQVNTYITGEQCRTKGIRNWNSLTCHEVIFTSPATLCSSRTCIPIHESWFRDLQFQQGREGEHDTFCCCQEEAGMPWQWYVSIQCLNPVAFWYRVWECT